MYVIEIVILRLDDCSQPFYMLDNIVLLSFHLLLVAFCTWCCAKHVIIKKIVCFCHCKIRKKNNKGKKDNERRETGVNYYALKCVYMKFASLIK